MRRDLGVNQSRQTALDEVMPCSENAGEKICKKGLDNSGNIEGNSNSLVASVSTGAYPRPLPHALAVFAEAVRLAPQRCQGLTHSQVQPGSGP